MCDFISWIEKDGKLERVPVDGVFVFIGFKPVGRGLFHKEHVEHDPNGYLITDQYMRTNIPGVYAVGDCAHFEDPKSGQPIPPRAHTTVRQAKIVAYNILADIRGRSKKA